MPGVVLFNIRVTKKGEKTPTNLQEVDEELCKAFGQEVHPVLYLWNWYDMIGLYLALGKDWEWIQNELQTEELKKVAGYLEEHYDVKAWLERL